MSVESEAADGGLTTARDLLILAIGELPFRIKAYGELGSARATGKSRFKKKWMKIEASVTFWAVWC